MHKNHSCYNINNEFNNKKTDFDKIIKLYKNLEIAWVEKLEYKCF